MKLVQRPISIRKNRLSYSQPRNCHFCCGIQSDCVAAVTAAAAKTVEIAMHALFTGVLSVTQPRQFL